MPKSFRTPPEPDQPPRPPGPPKPRPQSRLRRLLALDRRTLLLLAEAALHLALARCLLLIVPFASLAPSLGVQSETTPSICYLPHRETLRRISHALHAVSRRVPWQTECLVRAVAAASMLRLRGIEYTLYLGTARDKSGVFVAHAWLRSGDCCVTGADVMARFTVVQTFARFGRSSRRRRGAEG